MCHAQRERWQEGHGRALRVCAMRLLMAAASGRDGEVAESATVSGPQALVLALECLWPRDSATLAQGGRCARRERARCAGLRAASEPHLPLPPAQSKDTKPRHATGATQGHM